MPVVDTKPKTRRRWYQFRVRTLLLVMFAASVCAAWFCNWHPAREEHLAVAVLRKKGSLVLESAPRAWWREVLPWKSSPQAVSLAMLNVTDADLRPTSPTQVYPRLNYEQPLELALLNARRAAQTPRRPLRVAV